MRITAIVGLMTCLTCLAGTAVAQGPSYPNVDKPFVLALGDTVHLLSRLVHDAAPLAVPPGKRVDFTYSTGVPASDKNARMAQADRAAQTLGRQAAELGVRRMSIGICDSRACAERRHPPSEWYLYEQTNAGWKRVR